ncbi:MAG: class I SAM-dependent methyltransferase [Bryobacteraceae bacterium]
MSDLKTAELTAIIQEVRDRVRARYATGDAGGVPLPDLMPIVHARDAAQAKVAAIGSVNPRPPGLVNDLIQSVKRAVGRSLNWFVRDQVEFNRAALECVETLLEALQETRRALEETGRALDTITDTQAKLLAEAEEWKDIRTHWSHWRVDWEEKLTLNEVQFLRSVADLQAGFHHRASMMEANFRDGVRQQHGAYEAELDRRTHEVQRSLWSDLEKGRMEYDRLIHQELRTVRQRMTAMLAAPPTPTEVAPSEPVMDFDYLRFAQRFRGSEEYVRRGLEFYVPHFAGRTAVLDIGCGRGEFLELMREKGVEARGIDLSAESVNLCRAKGLAAETADLYAYLRDAAPGSLDGIFCSQVVEHLPPGRLAEFVALAHEALSRDGLLAIETPNPECLAIFATHFYLDPTHYRPVPSPLMEFYLEEAGFGGIRVERLAAAVDSMPSLAELPEGFRKTFFDGLDYAILARRL